jgi:mycoredoxin
VSAQTLVTHDPFISADGAPARLGITLYGAQWCGDTRRSERLLNRLGVDYTYVDVDDDEAGNAWATAQRDGERRIPTISLAPDQPLLFEPSDDELRDALVDSGYLSRTAAQEGQAAD